MSGDSGKVITALGPVDPAGLGNVLMHEHIYVDWYDHAADRQVRDESPMSDAHRNEILAGSIPVLERCRDSGCGTMLEATIPPGRAWPDVFPAMCRETGMNIVLTTGAYVDESGSPAWKETSGRDPIWHFVIESSVEELAGFFESEIAEGIHGTGVRAGALKISTIGVTPTPLEEKVIRAASRAQKRTGAPVTTHCKSDGLGAESAQLRIFDEEGVDLSRVVVGHTHGFLMDLHPGSRKVCIDWMKEGANFMPTNPYFGEVPERRRPLVECFHEVFDAGLGEHIVFGTDDILYSSLGKPFGMTDKEEPFSYMFTHTLPVFRDLGMTAEEEELMMRVNPRRILAFA